ncbi:hypothetical protein MIZ01_0674 [Sideroxyarcus emersonii]|uniref:Uncharacterized protein n=1 Tax=Sideroxyarcus emersonii TaxID=2764705 RepID=A0AAN1X8U8_9PROT|nr:hypothetical protein [Sideroxyarcus emersonii]BCK86908.1 hypothetical protein MIZ01_0674 [Sideroxyarcus emersonii]
MRFSVAGLLLLAGTMLPGGVHAVGPDAAAGSAQSAAQPVTTAAKQDAPLQKRKGKAVSKANAKKVDQKPQQPGVQESAPAATEQSVQLRGVRG